MASKFDIYDGGYDTPYYLQPPVAAEAPAEAPAGRHRTTVHYPLPQTMLRRLFRLPVMCSCEVTWDDCLYRVG